MLVLKPLCTIDQYKTYNRVSDNTSVGVQSKNFVGNKTNESDEEIMLYINAASNFVRNYTNIDFEPLIYTETQLTNYKCKYRTIHKIKEIISFEQDGFSISPEKLDVYGNLIMSNYISNASITVVKYISDFSVKVPDDIVQSVIHLASILSRKKDRIGVQSITNGDSTTNFQLVDIPEDIKIVLNSYQSFVSSGANIISKENIV